MKLILFISLLTTITIQASEKNKMTMMPTEMTLAERETMAVAHEKMSACLRSDKSLEICHNEMMETCTKVMGKNGCHMKNMHRMIKKELSN